MLILLSGLVGILGFSFSSALADAAPPDPPRGANPEVTEVTKVRMMAETVLVDIGAPMGDERWAAIVTASFTMRNMGEETEDLDVRFPLDYAMYMGGLVCENPSPDYPSITDLRVWVNGDSVPVSTEYVTVYAYPDSRRIDVPCWGHFQVRFPPGEDVQIRVMYTALPFDMQYVSKYSYAYILKTGAGWFGTIGSADIIFRMPYAITDENFYTCVPDDCQKDTYEIRWHKEDFEPDFNVEIVIMEPDVWQMLTASRERVSANPEDGDAWGRMGWAYKEIALIRKGGPFIGDEKAYQASKDAYERALSILPEDIDWHYGYAELMCSRAVTDHFSDKVPFTDLLAELRTCVEQLKIVLDARPNDTRALSEVEDVNWAFSCSTTHARECGQVIAMDSGQPDYLILTPGVSLSTEASPPDMTPLPTPALISHSTPTPDLEYSSPVVTILPPTASGVASSTPAPPVFVSPTDAPLSSGNSPDGATLPVLLAVLAFGGLWIAVRRFARNNAQ